MNAIYLDSSVAVAIIFRQSNYISLRNQLKKSKEIYSSFLFEAEVCSALCREKKATNDFYEYFDFINLVYPRQSLLNEYQQIFSIAYSRGADALHLATALYLDPEAKHFTFFSADQRQRQIAKSLGFKLNS